MYLTMRKLCYMIVLTGVLILFSIPSFGQYIHLPKPESKDKGRVFYRCSAFFELEPSASYEYKSIMDEYNINSTLWSCGVNLELYGLKSEKRPAVSAGVGLGYYSSSCSAYDYYDYKSSVNLMGVKASPYVILTLPPPASWFSLKLGINAYFNCRAKIPVDYNASWMHNDILSRSMIQYFVGTLYRTRYIDFAMNLGFYGKQNGPLDSDKLTYYYRCPFTSKAKVFLLSLGIYVRLFGNGYM